MNGCGRWRSLSEGLSLPEWLPEYDPKTQNSKLKTTPMFPSLRRLLANTVDYAGLFPPAKLSLSEAMANYGRDRNSPTAWMLNHFVLPAQRLEEFATGLSELSASDDKLQPWSLSLILSGNLERAISTLQTFNSKQITIASLEFPPLPSTTIKQLIPGLPVGVDTFFELPVLDNGKKSNPDNLQTSLAVLQGTGAAAKIRTGGLTPEAFPNAKQLAPFVLNCTQFQVPFKATAGLHHPLPAHRQLAPGLDSPSAEMHGFLNLAIAAAFAHQQATTGQSLALEDAIAILQEPCDRAFHVSDNGLSWRDRHLTLTEIDRSRQHCFKSFGSCSFKEPVEDLQNLDKF